MKQKPVLLLLMALSVTLGAVVYPVTGYLHFNSKQTLEEGTHPKNVNLAGPLAINSPPPLVLMADANCMAQVVVQTPVSTCGNITFMSYTLPNGNTVLLTPPYPATINLGMWSYGLYSIIWNVSDDCPPLPTQAICRQAVKIDTQPPVIMCPDDVSVENNEDGRRHSPAGDRMNLTNVEVGQPTAIDNCTPDALITITNDFNGTDDASGQYPLGSTVVCWTATDLSGNTASCCMNVTVFDNTPPEIKCPDTLYAQCSPPDPYADFSEFMDAGGTAEDETALDSTSLTWISDMTSDSLCPNRLTIHRSYAIRQQMNQRPGLYVVHSEDKGRGVFTSHDIPAGELIEICPVIIIPKAEVPIIHKTVIHDYYFLWGEDMEEAALALGFGSLYNHAVDPNANFILDMENMTIDIVSIADIAAGSEITINYHGEPGDDTPLWV